MRNGQYPYYWGYFSSLCSPTWVATYLNNSRTVVDPWLKLGYYQDNNWERKFIISAKETITKFYNDTYAPTEIFSEQSYDNHTKDEHLWKHVFTKVSIKVQPNEIESYVKLPRADVKQDTVSCFGVS